MEYAVDGAAAYAAATGALSAKTGTASSGFVLGTEGANPGNYAPRFDMSAD
jgi:hypothetical protein